MSSVPGRGGPPPKLPSKRRRANMPASYGLATPTQGGSAGKAPVGLGFPAHFLIRGLWKSLHTSVEAKFYSESDWQRVRTELWYGNQLIEGGHPSANAWSAFQSALNDLLISPADKRRAGIELTPAAEDPDQAAATVTLARYAENLGQTG